MSEQPSIEVKRRRKGGKPAGTADAPVRPSSGAAGGEASPVRPPSGGGFFVPSKGKLGGCGGALVVLLVIVFYILSGGNLGANEGGQVAEPPPAENQLAQNLPTNTPRPTKAAPAGQAGQTWLVMLYQDADDQVLEQDIFLDLNEAERVGSSNRVTIVSQVDRFRGAYQGDGNWTSTRRYLVTQDDDLSRIGSQMVADLGEVNMADGAALEDFVLWAMSTYPADRYVLLLSDHGMGWPGGWSDPSPSSSDPGRAPLISALPEDHLYLAEIDSALERIRQRSGLEKFDVIGMDACLMSQLEVYAALQPHARLAIASEETEPALGWAYTAFLQELADDPNMSAATLVTHVVDSYIAQDQRIVDDLARSEFLRQGSPMGGFFGASQVSAAQLARQIERTATLTAVDLDALPGLMQAFNGFLYALQSEDQALVARARAYAQSYTSVFGKQVPPSYIDLGHFVQLVDRESASGQVSQAATAVMSALDTVIVAEKHGSAKPGSTGIAIYFPNSAMYRSAAMGPQSYNTIASRFVKTSLWDDFLAFHYNDRSFQPTAAEPVAPAPGSLTRAPGAGNIRISNLVASNSTAAEEQPVRISADISGENIGYIYLFIGLYDRESNSIYVADMDYLESPETRQLGGVYYPAWGESESFTINFTWEPTLFSIADATKITLGLFNPVSYGATAEQAIYSLYGTYTFAESGVQQYAQLLFMDGKLIQVLGFKGADDTGTPAEITPAAGDTFTVLQKWMELDENGKATRIVYEPGDTLTFDGVTTFRWQEQYAPAGEYLIGFLVSDLDGNLTEAYIQVTVR